ncbi:MAG TPA: hypothetical protein VF765_08540 [Polyangiaceae bacterium]
MRLRTVALVLSTVAAACSSQSSSSSSNDVPVCVDADGGKPQDCLGCAVPEARWSDAGSLSCPRSVADYCNQNATPTPATTAPDCPPSTWNALLADEKQSGWPPLYYVCDGFDLAMPSWYCGTGTDVLFVYDAASGQLTSAVEFGNAAHAGQQTCLAGPANVAALNLVSAKCKPYTCFPGDSGVDGHTCDAAAAAD